MKTLFPPKDCFVIILMFCCKTSNSKIPIHIFKCQTIFCRIDGTIVNINISVFFFATTHRHYEGPHNVDGSLRAALIIHSI